MTETSGAYNFGITTQTDSIIEEAYDRCGKEPSELSAYDVQKAIRSLNFLFSDWSNKQCNLWTVELQVLPLESGREMYTLPNSTLALLQTATRIPQNGVDVDLIITGISRSDYLSIPDKRQISNRPTSFYFQRSVPPLLYVWPLPDTDDVKLVYYRIRAMQDFVGMTNGQDAPNRWMEAIASGLAVRLCEKGVGGDFDKLSMRADAAFNAAASEDRERVPLNITPDITMGGW